jgi:hypothetical protein
MEEQSMSRSVSFLFLSVFCLALLSPLSAQAGKNVTGIIIDIGRGRYVVKEKKGIERLIYVSRHQTTFTPKAWRPARDDRVRISYYGIQGRRGVKLVATSIKLLKAGAGTVILKSPVRGKIVKTGRRAVLVFIPSRDLQVRFATGRNTILRPAGWIPRAGEKVKITFKAVRSRWRNRMGYVAEKIERR